MSIKVIQNQPTQGSVIFTSSQNWVVPPGVFKIKILCIGGGGGGGGGYSSTYTGGGGGSGAVQYAEAAVIPGETLQIVVGAGGSPGTGGSSPTAGGAGGNTGVFTTMYSSNLSLDFVLGGGGGGAATSSANGANGKGGTYGQVGWRTLVAFYIVGAGGNGTNPSWTQILPLGSAVSTSNIGTVLYLAMDNTGYGGAGGGVNANGNPGGNGMVIIWWGD